VTFSVVSENFYSKTINQQRHFSPDLLVRGGHPHHATRVVVVRTFFVHRVCLRVAVLRVPFVHTEHRALPRLTFEVSEFASDLKNRPFASGFSLAETVHGPRRPERLPRVTCGDERDVRRGRPGESRDGE